jgi:succinate-acetate transporter protein
MRTNLSANLPGNQGSTNARSMEPSLTCPGTDFGGEMQLGLYRSVPRRKFANSAPLGLSAFALTTIVLSLINLEVRNLSVPNIMISLAFSYGGLVQLLPGMW